MQKVIAVINISVKNTLYNLPGSSSYIANLDTKGKAISIIATINAQLISIKNSFLCAPKYEKNMDRSDLLKSFSFLFFISYLKLKHTL